GTVCVVGKMRDLILQLSKSSIYSTKPRAVSKIGLAPIFPYTFYHLTHYWFAAAGIPVVNDIPVH
ncbi:hypothetical protein DMP51_28425, partial [Klebsiella pneumoniae]